MSIKRLFNDQWRFTKQEPGQTTTSIHSESITWQPVDLPHDWLIYQAKNLYETSEGWYQRILKKSELIPDMCYALRFEGVYMNSSLYINGVLAGEWKYGYSTFEFDITDFLTQEENEILVQVVYECPNSRWYSGAGIYRNVWLKTYPASHLTSDGIYVTAKPQDNDTWEVMITSELSTHAYDTKPGLSYHPAALEKESQTVHNYQLRHTIYEFGTDVIAASAKASVTMNGAFLSIDQMMSVTAPKVWDIEVPNLYTLKTELLKDDVVIDSKLCRFGFRTIEFTSDAGFFLNGRHVKLFGTCEHHDLGCLGAAMNRTALKRELLLLKEMGVNAVRTSHNMPSVEMMELADELGILIDSEGFDMWELPKTTYDYARFFKDWVDLDVASWIRRDRNHPSIILWSVGNEIYDTHANEHGQDITKRLKALVYQHDYRHIAPVTIGSNYMPWEGAQNCAKLIDAVGYNYAEKYYEEHHKKYPDWKMYGSETASTVQSRGIYHFPYTQTVLSDDDEQCSCLGNCCTSWGAKNSEYCITMDRDATYSAGQFIWTGFDYIGEPTPYFTKNSYFGQIDTAGFCKDTFYIYQAEWTDYKKAPMIHILPYWDFSAGQTIDVRVISNAPKVELFFNETSVGTYEIDHVHGTVLSGNWQLPYQTGTLRGVAYDEDNNVIAVEEKTSFGDAASIVLTADKTTLLANGEDLVFVTISMADSNGNPVENANNRVLVNVSGAGRLIGLDNGDSTDYDEYKGTSRRLFGGKLLAVVAAKLTTGVVHVSVTSEGLEPADLELNAIEAPITEGVSAFTENVSSDSNVEIPIRKLEIVVPEGTSLNETKNSVKAYVKVFPENATYHDIVWRITTASGIDTNLAALETNGDEVTVTALGSGEAYLRCSCKNGGDKVSIISMIDFTFSGLGDACIDPYQFVAGGLYNASNYEMTNGNERGVATLRDQDSWIGFRNVNFGSYGSDEVTIPIFALNDEALPIDIWEGMPDEAGSELLASVVYQKPSIWNTYQAETYRLKRRIKGLTTICFVVRKKIHIKGFSFTKYEKAFQKLMAAEADSIYGDTFTKTEDAILGIGNNVALEFTDMDFGTDGISSLTICGHSPIEKNTIHVRITNEDGTTPVIAEFTHSEDYKECSFEMPKLTGSCKVALLFLPGSNFDLRWIKFD